MSVTVTETTVTLAEAELFVSVVSTSIGVNGTGSAYRALAGQPFATLARVEAPVQPGATVEAVTAWLVFELLAELGKVETYVPASS